MTEPTHTAVPATLPECAEAFLVQIMALPLPSDKDGLAALGKAVAGGLAMVEGLRRLEAAGGSTRAPSDPTNEELACLIERARRGVAAMRDEQARPVGR